MYNFRRLRVLLLIGVILCGIWETPQKALAKVSVTKTVTTISKKSLNASVSYRTTYDLYSMGNPLWISADAEGKTHVFVNEHGSDFCNCEECEAILPEEYPITWNNVNVHAIINPDKTDLIKVKMDGGSVQSLILSQAIELEPRNFNLQITGGTLSGLRMPNEGVYDVYISNLRYTGAQIHTGMNESSTLFINNDCEFYAGSAVLSETELETLRGAFVPNIENPNEMFAYGNAYVPAGMNVKCDHVVDKGMNSLTVATSASVTINKCDGWQSAKSIPARVNVQAHNQISYVKQPASCLYSEQTVIYCDLCGKSEISVTQSALGHNYVDDPAIPATCYHPGLSAGKHCSRCGKSTSRTTIPQLTHEYGSTVSRQISCAQPKFGSKPIVGGATVEYKVCKNCRQIVYITDVTATHDMVTTDEMYGLSGGFAITINGQTQKTTYKEFAILAKRLEHDADCTHDGLKFKICKQCQYIQTEVTPALGHTKTYHKGKSATCVFPGNKSYYSCDRCGILYESTPLSTYSDESDVYIAPKGHKYGVPESYIKNDFTKVSNQTCDMPAIYHQTCANCGKINENLIFYGEAALGHQYHIKSIDYKDPTYPDEGYLTVECTNASCHRTWPGLLYMISDKVGTPKEDGTYTGYWTKTQLIETTQMPTCQPGWGKYRLTLNFHGTKMTEEYENYVTPMGYVHNYDDNGVCHEHHYEWDRDEDGTIVKYFAGEIQNKNFGNATQGVFEFHDDETVYSTQGYIAVPYQAPCMYDDGKTPITDPEDGSRMYYTDYQVTNVATQQEFLNAVAAQTGDFYAAYYGDLVFDIADETAHLALDKLNSENMLGDLYVPESKQSNVCLNDQSNLTNTENIYTPNLKYVRTFAQAGVWESLYVPMSFDVSANSDICEFADIYSFGQLFDTNGNGRIDGGDDVWLIVDMMTSGLTAGNYPYLIRAKEAGTVELEAYDGVLYAANNTKNSCSTGGATYTFCGTNVNADLSSANTNFMMDPNGNLNVTANQTITPQRWHVQVTGSSNSAELRQAMASGIRVMVMGEDISQETAIRLLQGETVEVNLDGQHYTLDGRKATNTPSGIQVVNGHKIISK